jgi:hypothetical protein
MAADEDTARFEDWDWVLISDRVTDDNFSVGDQKFIRYPTNANNGTQ